MTPHIDDGFELKREPRHREQPRSYLPHEATQRALFANRLDDPDQLLLFSNEVEPGYETTTTPPPPHERAKP